MKEALSLFRLPDEEDKELIRQARLVSAKDVSDLYGMRENLGTAQRDEGWVCPYCAEPVYLRTEHARTAPKTKEIVIVEACFVHNRPLDKEGFGAEICENRSLSREGREYLRLFSQPSRDQRLDKFNRMFTGKWFYKTFVESLLKHLPPKVKVSIEKAYRKYRKERLDHFIRNSDKLLQIDSTLEQEVYDDIQKMCSTIFSSDLNAPIDKSTDGYLHALLTTAVGLVPGRSLSEEDWGVRIENWEKSNPAEQQYMCAYIDGLLKRMRQIKESGRAGLHLVMCEDFIRFIASETSQQIRGEFLLLWVFTSIFVLEVVFKFPVDKDSRTLSAAPFVYTMSQIATTDWNYALTNNQPKGFG